MLKILEKQGLTPRQVVYVVVYNSTGNQSFINNKEFHTRSHKNSASEIAEWNLTSSQLSYLMELYSAGIITTKAHRICYVCIFSDK